MMLRRKGLLEQPMSAFVELKLGQAFVNAAITSCDRGSPRDQAVCNSPGVCPRKALAPYFNHCAFLRSVFGLPSFLSSHVVQQ